MGQANGDFQQVSKAESVNAVSPKPTKKVRLTEELTAKSTVLKADDLALPRLQQEGSVDADVVLGVTLCMLPDEEPGSIDGLAVETAVSQGNIIVVNEIAKNVNL